MHLSFHALLHSHPGCDKSAFQSHSDNTSQTFQTGPVLWLLIYPIWYPLPLELFTISSRVHFDPKQIVIEKKDKFRLQLVRSQSPSFFLTGPSLTNLKATELNPVKKCGPICSRRLFSD